MTEAHQAAGTQDTNGRNLRARPRAALPPTHPRTSLRLREEPRHRTPGGIRWQPDTDGAPGGERAGRRVGTPLEDGDRDTGVFLTDLPSRAERNTVRTEADPEHGYRTQWRVHRAGGRECSGGV